MATRLANLLAATGRLVEDSVEQRLDRELPHGASAPAALVSVAHQPGLSIDRLRRALGLTHSGAVRLVDRLEADGLLHRDRGGGRSVALRLTGRGRRAVSRLAQARLEAVADLLAPLSPGARRELEPILSELLAARTGGQADLERICRLCSFSACESEGRRCPVAEAARNGR